MCCLFIDVDLLPLINLWDEGVLFKTYGVLRKLQIKNCKTFIYKSVYDINIGKCMWNVI